MRSAVVAAALAVVVLGGGIAYAYAADKADAKPKPSTDPLQHLTDLLQAQASCSEIRAAAVAVPDLPKDIAAKIDTLCPPSSPAAPASPGTPPGPAPVTPGPVPMTVDVAALEERLAEMLLLPDPSLVCSQMQALVQAIEANGGTVPQSAKDVIALSCSPDKGNGGLPPGWTQS